MAKTEKDFRRIAGSLLNAAGRTRFQVLDNVAKKLAETDNSAFLEGYRAAQENGGGRGKEGKPLPPVEEAGTSPAASEGDSQIHSDCTFRNPDVAGRDFAAEISEGDSRISREVWRWEGRRGGLQEGREAGLKEGFEAGHAKGHAKGYVDGHADGREEVQRQVAEAFAEGEAAGFEKGGSGLYAEGFEAGRQAHAAEVRAGGGLFAVGFDKGREEGFTAGRNNGLVEGQKEIAVIADQLARARRLLFRARSCAFIPRDGNETYKAINKFLKETAPS